MAARIAGTAPVVRQERRSSRSTTGRGLAFTRVRFYEVDFICQPLGDIDRAGKKAAFGKEHGPFVELFESIVRPFKVEVADGVWMITEACPLFGQPDLRCDGTDSVPLMFPGPVRGTLKRSQVAGHQVRPLPEQFLAHCQHTQVVALPTWPWSALGLFDYDAGVDESGDLEAVAAGSENGVCFPPDQCQNFGGLDPRPCRGPCKCSRWSMLPLRI